jgi:hypothetical protein
MKKIKFGRLYKPDPRDNKFLMKPNLKKAASISYRYWSVGNPLDQGATPQCVAYAGFKYLTAGPVKNVKLPFTPSQLYKFAQENDEWPGENYDGTSVRGLFKYLNKTGYVPKYEWTFDANVLSAFILTIGPVVVGTDWLSNMMDCPKSGILKVSGSVEGGHGYVLHGYNQTKKLFRMINSWGDWGQNGKAWIHLEDFQGLLGNQGEACTATEVLLKK